MEPKPEMVEVRSVNAPSYRGRLQKDKYDAMKRVLLKVLPAAGPGMTQREMFEAANAHAPRTLFPNMGKVMWWAKSVQLNLEARGILRRDAKAKPLRWKKA